MKLFKDFKKNEIVIYAIVLMLVTAGYFNYTTNLEISSVETYSESVDNIINENYADIGDARLVNSNDVEENVEVNETNAQISDIGEADNNEEIEDETQINSNNNEDYFVNSKLERDTNYASMISNYTKILSDSSISETQKAIAMQEITNINNTKSAIQICENLLSTKGFKNSIVLVNNGNVNVVVELEESLTVDKVAQIQNIISRELDSEIEDIHISEK